MGPGRNIRLCESELHSPMSRAKHARTIWSLVSAASASGVRGLLTLMMKVRQSKPVNLKETKRTKRGP